MKIQMTICIVILFLVCCPVDMLNIPEQDILDVYNEYREAAADAEGRRSASKYFSKNNREYEIHIERLKGVNGLKAHNLIIRTGTEPDTNKTMYINNPVESKMPQAYLSLDEFKQALINRVMRVKKNNATLDKAKLKSKILTLWKMKRKGSKLELAKNVVRKRVHSANSTRSYAKKHRSNIILNPLTEVYKINVTVSTNTIGRNSNKEQNETNVPQIHSVTKNLPPNNKTEIITKSIQLGNHNFTEDISEMSLETTTTLAEEKTVLLRSQNITEHVSETNAATSNVPDVTTAQTESSIDMETSVETMTESTLELKATEVETTEEVTEIKEDATTESATVETDQPPTTLPLTTVSKRVTLGRPAVYMGDV